MDVMDVEGFEVQDGFELAGSAESDRERRHSDPPSGKAERPAISKRTRSAPPVSAPKPPTDSWLENAAENEHGKPNPKRQNTLTRQKGVRSPDKETGANYTPRRAASSIELRSEDDGMLVVMANPSDGEPEDLDGSDLEIECCDEPYERPECRPLVERHRGSTSSASQSDADQDADNGSVSVALSVSSLGNDEDILVEEPDDPHDDEEPVVIAAPRDKPHPAQVLVVQFEFVRFNFLISLPWGARMCVCVEGGGGGGGGRGNSNQSSVFRWPIKLIQDRRALKQLGRRRQRQEPEGKYVSVFLKPLQICLLLTSSNLKLITFGSERVKLIRRRKTGLRCKSKHVQSRTLIMLYRTNRPSS